MGDEPPKEAPNVPKNESETDVAKPKVTPKKLKKPTKVGTKPKQVKPPATPLEIEPPSELEEPNPADSVKCILVGVFVAVALVAAVGIAIYFMVSNGGNEEIRSTTIVDVCDGKPCVQTTKPSSAAETTSPGSTQSTTLPPKNATSTTTPKPPVFTQTATTKPSTTTTSRPTDVCAREACGTAHALYYFPRIVERASNYSSASGFCSPLYQGYAYALSGLDQANVMFLGATANMVAGIQGVGAWVGGHFDLKSSNPYFVRWDDGRISDSLKSPNEIWCKHPRDVIPALLTANTASVLPIARLKNQSHCLTLYDGDASKSAIYPLCVTNSSQVYLKLADRVLVPPVYEQLFDKQALGFVGLNQKFNSLAEEQQKSTMSNVTIATPHVVNDVLLPLTLAGVKQLVTHGYARALCANFYYAAGSRAGSLPSQLVMNDVFYSMKIQAQRARLSPLSLTSSLTTLGRLDFQQSSMSDALTVTYRDGVYGSPTPFNQRGYPWCTGDAALHDGANIKAYQDFAKWYASGGNRTTGPYHVYLAIEATTKDSSVNVNGREYPVQVACVRYVYDDLYWPGTHQWAPLCETLKP